MIHGGENLPTEIGALIRLNFTNKEIEQMGLNWLTTMHEPIEDSDGDPGLALRESARWQVLVACELG
jgi:hypothetical protein